MDVKEFTAAYREAFGERPELPLLFRYTDTPLRPVEKVGGCFFKALAEARRVVNSSFEVKTYVPEYRLRGREVLHGIQPDARIRSAVRVAQGAL